MIDAAGLAEPRRASRSLWIVAAALALAVHLGGAALVVAQVEAEPDDALGAPTIEIGLELSAPRSETTDLPPGPEAEASADSPAVAEQKAVAEQTDLPKAVPTETEDPDRVVAPESREKPKDEEQKVAVVETSASTESVAAEATAPPSSEVLREAERSVAPVQGAGESAQRVRTTWHKQLLAHLDRHKRYPAGTTRKAAEIVVTFSLDRTGRVLSAAIAKGSGDPAFDEAALAMMKRSDPVPPAPPLVADEGLTFTLPVIFRQQRGRG